MSSFTVKLVTTSLFPPTDFIGEALYSAFASSSTCTLEFTEPVLELVADSLELDLDGLLVSALRYTRGDFRPKTRGLSGDTLGTFGEVLVFLLGNSPTREFVRIEGPVPGKKPEKGDRFPCPDFLVRENGAVEVLEVKSTQAFDIEDLSDIGIWKRLNPCHGVSQCRSDALFQLGREEGQPTPTHALKTKAGPIPFPADSGVAVSVLVQDGRVRDFRNDSRLKAEPTCRKAKPERSCFSCIKEDHHAVVTTMRNAPGRLSLLGGGRRTRWFESYRSWKDALWSSDVTTIEIQTAELVGETLEALSEPSAATERDQVGAFWEEYLGDAAAIRGVADLGSLQRLPDPRRVRGATWTPRVPRGVRAERTEGGSLDRIRAIVQQRSEAKLSILDQGRDGAHAFSFVSDANQWTLSLIPSLEHRDLDAIAAASVANRLLGKALEIEGTRIKINVRDQGEPLSLEAITYQLQGREVSLGWRIRPLWNYDIQRPFAFIWPHPELAPWWLFGILTGDPRIRLFVHKDGRGRLQVPHSPPAERPSRSPLGS